MAPITPERFPKMPFPDTPPVDVFGPEIEKAVEVPDSIGYDFEDKQTRLEMDLIDELHRLGLSKYLDLPQMVVVGDQSTGKSSVLRAVTDISFPFHDKMCTRFATEIFLQRTPHDQKTSVDVSIIPDPNEDSERREALLQWKPEAFDQTARLDEKTIRSIFEQAGEIICNGDSGRNRYGKNSNRLSSSTLRITRRGPKEVNFAIVDLPGLVRDGHDTRSEHKTAKYLVKKYLQNPRSIVVVVVDVLDLDRQEIFQMLNDIPDVDSRVVGVINKCDTKQKNSDDWVFDAIRNGSISKIKGGLPLNEGWFGLRNRTPSERNVNDAERDRLEEEFFAGDEWASLDPNKLGRHSLKKALIRMRNNHVKQTIPELLSDINLKLIHCEDDIAKLGKARQSPHDQFTSIHDIATNYSSMAKGAVMGHYESLNNEVLFARKRIRDDLDQFQAEMGRNGFKIPFRSGKQDAADIANLPNDDWAKALLDSETYKWISTAITKYRAREDKGEINPEAKDQLWQEQTASWKDIASVALAKIEQTVDSVNIALFKRVCPEDQFRIKLQEWLQKDIQKAINDAKIELDLLLENEKMAHLYTLHPVKLVKQQEFRSQRTAAIVEAYRITHPEAIRQYKAEQSLNIKAVPADLVVNFLIYSNADLVGVLNTHDSLAAYYDVALYRFIDNFAMQVVERHLLGPKGPLRIFTPSYVFERLHSSENEKELDELASESAVIVKQRSDLATKLADLKASRQQVQRFKLA